MMMNIGARGHDFKTVHSPAELGKRFKNKGFNIIQLSLPASFPEDRKSTRLNSSHH